MATALLALGLEAIIGPEREAQKAHAADHRHGVGIQERYVGAPRGVSDLGRSVLQHGAVLFVVAGDEQHGLIPQRALVGQPAYRPIGVVHVAGEHCDVEVESFGDIVAVRPSLAVQIGCDEKLHGAIVVPLSARGKSAL